MKSKLIAVATDKENKISSHAGRSTRWSVYGICANKTVPERLWSITLTEAGTLHEWHKSKPQCLHPLHSVDVAIAGSAGKGVYRCLGERDTELLVTKELDPLTAINAYVNGTLSVVGIDDLCRCSKQQ